MVIDTLETVTAPSPPLPPWHATATSSIEVVDFFNLQYAISTTSTVCSVTYLTHTNYSYCLMSTEGRQWYFLKSLGTLGV